MSKNKVISNMSYLTIVQLLNYAFPLITIPIASRALGVDKLGLINYIFAFMAYFTLIINYGFNYTAIRRASKTKNINLVYSLVLSTQFYLLLISTFMFFICILIFSDLKNNLILSIVTYFACIATFFNQSWVFQFYGDLKIVACIELIIRIFSTLLIVFLVKTSMDYIWYALIVNGVVLIGSVISLFTAIYKYNLVIMYQSIKAVLECLKEDKELFFSSVVINIYTTTSVVLLGMLVGSKDVGLYSSAQKIIDLARAVVVQPIFQVFFSILSKSFHENKANGIDFLKKIMPLFIIVSLFLFIGTIVLGPLAINILYGKAFFGSIPVLYILAFGFLFQFFSMIYGLFLMVNLGLDKQFLNQQVIVALLSVIITILVLPFGGSQTTAIIWAISECLILLGQVFTVNKAGYHVIDRKSFSKESLKQAFILLKNS